MHFSRGNKMRARGTLSRREFLRQSTAAAAMAAAGSTLWGCTDRDRAELGELALAVPGSIRALAVHSSWTSRPGAVTWAPRRGSWGSLILLSGGLSLRKKSTQSFALTLTVKYACDRHRATMDQ
jgi:hypothetical protein